MRQLNRYGFKNVTKEYILESPDYVVFKNKLFIKGNINSINSIKCITKSLKKDNDKDYFLYIIEENKKMKEEIKNLKLFTQNILFEHKKLISDIYEFKHIKNKMKIDFILNN